MNKSEALAKIKELEKYIENLDKRDSRWKPSINEQYWYVWADEACYDAHNTGTYFDEECYKLGNCFPTKELAQLHALRLEAMANRWLPKYDEYFFYWSFNDKEAYRDAWYGLDVDLTKYIIGNCHKSEKEAEEYGAKYDKAFRVLWEDKWILKI